MIDEIDKADIEFPNDLLLEIDKMEFYCYELQETIVAKHRPIIIISSNNEKELPDAFLRRCFFHYIRFPEKDTMQKIVDVHFPNIEQELVDDAMKAFYEVRDTQGIKKKPSTSELIDWIRLLKIGNQKISDATPKNELPNLGALLKNEQDIELLIRMAKMGMRRY